MVSVNDISPSEPGFIQSQEHCNGLPSTNQGGLRNDISGTQIDKPEPIAIIGMGEQAV